MGMGFSIHRGHMPIDRLLTCRHPLRFQVCVFPFFYNGIAHDMCTYADHDQPWCYTPLHFIPNATGPKWGHCTGKTCPIEPTHSPTTPTPTKEHCHTTEGTRCHLPFNYNGRAHTKCTYAGATFFFTMCRRRTPRGTLEPWGTMD